MTRGLGGRNSDPGKEVPEPAEESVAAVVAAGAANVLIGIFKFVVASITGSSAMMSEGIHSVVDTANELLILLGIRRSHHTSDAQHPFGYGMELYFWTLIVSILIFAVGGGLSFMHGWQAALSPDPAFLDESPVLSYVVIAVSAVLEGISLAIGIRQYNAARGAMGALEFLRESKDPSLYTVVLEDSAAEAGLAVAFLGVFLGHALARPELDGIASCAIGLILMAVALVLLHETKGLLVGEGLRPSEVHELQALVEATPGVTSCGRALTLYLGPHSLLVACDVDFDDSLDDKGVVETTDLIEEAIRVRFPQTTRIFVEAKNAQGVAATRAKQERKLSEGSRRTTHETRR